MHSLQEHMNILGQNILSHGQVIRETQLTVLDLYYSVCMQLEWILEYIIHIIIDG